MARVFLASMAICAAGAVNHNTCSSCAAERDSVEDSTLLEISRVSQPNKPRHPAGQLHFLQKAEVPGGSFSVRCMETRIDTLTRGSDKPGDGPFALICSPTNAGQSHVYPLHVYAHGNGNSVSDYQHAVERIASFGFIATAYESCKYSHRRDVCDAGKTSYLEALNLIDAFLSDPDFAGETGVDVSKSVSVSGHSTGGRVALMLASAKDSKTYLRHTDTWPKEERLLTALSKIGAASAFNPDHMYKSSENPDVQNYAISQTPTLFMTGSEDPVEDRLSAWTDFQMASVEHKAYINMRNADHNALMNGSAFDTVNYVALWSQAFALGNETAKAYIYGDGPMAMRNALDYTKGRDRNAGNGSIGLLLCGTSGETWPSDKAEACRAVLCGSVPGSPCCKNNAYPNIGGDGCSNTQQTQCMLDENTRLPKGADSQGSGYCASCGNDGEMHCDWQPPDTGRDGCATNPPTEKIQNSGLCSACGKIDQRCCRPHHRFGSVGDDGCIRDVKCNTDTNICHQE